MHSRQVLTAITLMAVLSWSVVMAALGYVAAIAALVPSLGLLVQQIVNALTSARPPQADVPPHAATQDEGRTR
ncbi:MULTISPECIES: hypothetical protein [Streptomyces violaceusniger group]|uniref:Secreted protein n=2 Tax=Streptomyces rhizosphaericus TaxID=114699 RepID=A0ABP4CNH1_9ACTN|nr:MULTISPECIES: hypothetical protein [Streptomyces violaceusniger group]